MLCWGTLAMADLLSSVLPWLLKAISSIGIVQPLWFMFVSTLIWVRDYSVGQLRRIVFEFLVKLRWKTNLIRETIDWYERWSSLDQVSLVQANHRSWKLPLRQLIRSKNLPLLDNNRSWENDHCLLVKVLWLIREAFTLIVRSDTWNLLVHSALWFLQDTWLLWRTIRDQISTTKQVSDRTGNSYQSTTLSWLTRWRLHDAVFEWSVLY